MKRSFQSVLMLSIILIAASVAFGQQPANKDSQSHHHAEVNRRGDEAMGFSHLKTTHHFRLAADGGAIDVSANEAADAKSRDQIRGHLAHIEKLFAAGDFSMPMLTHGKEPPGVPVMKKLKDQISYKYEETERGGRVRISTSNGEAIEAIHQFLRFQIEDHQTGDSLEVQK